MRIGFDGERGRAGGIFRLLTGCCGGGCSVGRAAGCSAFCLGFCRNAVGFCGGGLPACFGCGGCSGNSLCFGVGCCAPGVRFSGGAFGLGLGGTAEFGVCSQAFSLNFGREAGGFSGGGCTLVFVVDPALGFGCGSLACGFGCGCSALLRGGGLGFGGESFRRLVSLAFSGVFDLSLQDFLGLTLRVVFGLSLQGFVGLSLRDVFGLSLRDFIGLTARVGFGGQPASFGVSGGALGVIVGAAFRVSLRGEPFCICLGCESFCLRLCGEPTCCVFGANFVEIEDWCSRLLLGAATGIGFGGEATQFVFGLTFGLQLIGTASVSLRERSGVDKVWNRRGRARCGLLRCLSGEHACASQPRGGATYDS